MSSERKTMRVRVAVAVGSHGRWAAHAEDIEGDDGNEFAAREALLHIAGRGTEAVYWLEADVPIPEQQTFEASVTEGQP